MSEAARCPAIETRDIAKRYGAIEALRDLTLTVGRGEIFGFLGPNGAGKTTAVKILLGLTRATAGRGAILGRPIGDLEARRRVGYLPELFRYQEWLTPYEVLAFHAALIGIARGRRAGEIERVITAVGLEARAKTRVGGFSKGMQQRLGLGVALLGDPELLVLDEPTSALDPVGRHDVRTIVRDVKARGTTVFLNSHLLNEVEAVCDRIAILDKGRVIASGPVREVVSGFTLRVKFSEAPRNGAWDALAPHDPLSVDAQTFVLRAIEEAQVPDLVAALVARGARVASIEPVRGTLEERFLALVKEEDGEPARRVTGRP